MKVLAIFTIAVLVAVSKLNLENLEILIDCEFYFQVLNAAPQLATRNQNMLTKIADKISDVEKRWNSIDKLTSPIKLALQNAIDADENRLAQKTAVKAAPVVVVDAAPEVIAAPVVNAAAVVNAAPVVNATPVVDAVPVVVPVAAIEAAIVPVVVMTPAPVAPVVVIAASDIPVAIESAPIVALAVNAAPIPIIA